MKIKRYWVLVYEQYYKKSEPVCVGCGFTMQGAQQIIHDTRDSNRLKYYDIKIETLGAA